MGGRKGCKCADVRANSESWLIPHRCQAASAAHSPVQVGLRSRSRCGSRCQRARSLVRAPLLQPLKCLNVMRSSAILPKVPSAFGNKSKEHLSQRGPALALALAPSLGPRRDPAQFGDNCAWTWGSCRTFCVCPAPFLIRDVTRC